MTESGAGIRIGRGLIIMVEVSGRRRGWIDRGRGSGGGGGSWVANMMLIRRVGYPTGPLFLVFVFFLFF